MTFLRFLCVRDILGFVNYIFEITVCGTKFVPIVVKYFGTKSQFLQEPWSEQLRSAAVEGSEDHR